MTRLCEDGVLRFIPDVEDCAQGSVSLERMGNSRLPTPYRRTNRVTKTRK